MQGVHRRMGAITLTPAVPIEPVVDTFITHDQRHLNNVVVRVDVWASAQMLSTIVSSTNGMSADERWVLDREGGLGA